MKIAVVGAGYWGKNLIRNMYQLGALAAVCDVDGASLEKIKRTFPGIEAETDLSSVLDNQEIQAVVIATPAATHYAVAKQCLSAGKHVLVEKPFALSLKEADELISIACEKKLVLMVGMTFIYNAAVRKVKELIRSGALGDIYYVYFERVNLGKVRTDVNVWWNLAPHDISIALYWLDSEIDNLTARGACYLQKDIEDVAWANIQFKNNTCVLIHTSWLHPHKTRKAIVVGSKKMVVYDEISSDMKIQVYDKGIDKKDISKRLGEYENFGQFQLIQRAGDIFIPKINFTEPLLEECSHFIDCIKTNKCPRTDGVWSREIVKVLEAGQKSMKKNGKLVKL
ncbi:MAG: Gfo/Idh/MocA family oxidoreductase [bacterium]